MNLYVIPAFLLLSIMVVAMVIISGAMRRFIEGDFKNILRWLRTCLWYTTFSYIILVTSDLFQPSGVLREVMTFVMYISMAIVGYCILKAAVLINEFSKGYGFATMLDRIVKKKR